MKKIIALLTLFSLSSFATASEQISGLSEAQAQLDISRVEKQITLATGNSDSSFLRVGLVVLDNGGSTDVSPLASLYLTTFNQSEMKGAKSAHSLGPINAVISAEAQEGRYEVVVSRYDFEGECPSENGLESLVKITIDAQNLLADIKSFKDVDEFDSKTMQTPITIERSCLE